MTTLLMEFKKSIMTLLKCLEEDTYSVLNWFRYNEMMPNQGKCHLMIADIDHKFIWKTIS